MGILILKKGTLYSQQISSKIRFCIFCRFSVGMGFSCVYGALLTKTNRISRIFHSASQSARRPSYISPRSQLIITAVLVSVQFLATMLWIVAALPAAQKVYPQRSEVRNQNRSKSPEIAQNPTNS